jgi:hypothetical protein
MPLQNRVDPFGALFATSARGAFMGNRGARPLHRPDKSLRASRSREIAWICCLTSFKGWSRSPVWGAGYTELFFLDEATALAAGHRPCFLCRREDADAFRLAAFGRKAPAGEIDRALEAERIAPRPVVARADADALPRGAMVADLPRRAAWLRHETGWLRWSAEGYRDGAPSDASLSQLTPATSLRALRAGYRPQIAAKIMAATAC